MADSTLKSGDSAFAELLAAARREHLAGGGAVLDILMRQTGCDPIALDERLRRVAGAGLVLNVVDLEPDFSILSPEDSRSMHCVALRDRSGRCLWAAEDPWEPALQRKMRSQVAYAPKLALASRDQIARWLGGEQRQPSRSAGSTVSKPAASVDGPIVEFVDAAIRAAISRMASDAHFECDRHGVTAKLRIDGVLSTFSRLDNAQAAQEVISRIKVMAQLDITERRLPQDGRFRFEQGSDSIDLRVSVMPSVFGEDAVLRLLDKGQLRTREAAASTLDALGFDARSAELIREIAAEPSGMLLVTGPTGSGKTTSVYAVLSEINNGQEKIITIEDPVEYELPGVLQIPVNERKGLTFAKGLRSILRHDPDRILVGEIRDAETAEIAVQSALTGHLVFTTVHANGITDVMGRFRHFGLDMFALMSSLNGVVVQRLVRRVCPECVGDRAPTLKELAWLNRLGQSPVSRIAQPRGCPQCGHKGYRGRLVIAEVHRIDDTMRDHVTHGAPVTILKQHAEQAGVESLSQQAGRWVTAGLTTPEEIRRVVGWF